MSKLPSRGSEILGPVSHAQVHVRRETYTRPVSIFPYNCGSLIKEVLQIRHGGYRVKDEADKVRKCPVRDAVGGPWTMMIHFRDAPKQGQPEDGKVWW